MNPAARARVRRSAAISPFALGAALLALVWGVLLWDFRRHADFTREENHRDLEAVTEIGAQALRFTVRSIDLLLLDLREHWEADTDGFGGKVRRREADARVVDPFVIDVIGRDGRLLYSSRTPSLIGADASERHDFRALVDEHPRDALAIVGPLPGRPAERAVVHLSRPLRSRDGGFAGVVALSARADYLLQTERVGHVPGGTAFTVFRDDGSVLVRIVKQAASATALAPSGAAAPGAPPAVRPLPDLSRLDPRESGFLRMRDPVDDVERLVSWRSLDNYPLTLVVGEPAVLIDDEIAHLLRRYLVAGTLSSLLLLLALYWLLRARRVRERAAARERADLAELTRNAAALRASQQQARELAAHQIVLKEEERKRIAQEIHDELGQRLTVLRMDLSMLPRAVGSDPAALLPAQVAALKTSLDGIMALVRDIAGRLRPATLDVGLAAAAEGLVDEFRAGLGIVCELDNRLPPTLDVKEALATASFRILQESLTNVARHANATRVRVLLEVQDTMLHVQVQDDGSGIDASARASPSFGLSGMRERAAMLGGRVAIASHPGAGTTVDAWLSLDPPAEPSATASERVPENETRDA